MTELNRITANEARTYIENNWKRKLNEIYEGIRAAIEIGVTAYSFDISKIDKPSRELVLKQLEQADGYRVVQTSWNSNHYTIFW